MMKRQTGLSVAKAVDKKPKKRQTWSQTKRMDDVSEEMRVEELDNGGYLVILTKSGPDKKGEWYHKESKVYSKNNPLDPNEDDNPVDTLFKTITGNRR